MQLSAENSQGVFGASGATSFLGKLTYAAAMVFMTTSVALAIIQGKATEVVIKTIAAA